MPFQVTNIIGGDTIEVQGWSWNGRSGRLVKIFGYTITDPTYTAFANKKLTTLLKDKMVDLKEPKGVEGISDGNDVLICSVFLNNIDIAQYFPELQNNTHA